jgi:hypothetical protein
MTAQFEEKPELMLMTFQNFVSNPNGKTVAKTVFHLVVNILP